jgi:succinate dehydrogenase / fumarate reductase cytochrome b subunit
MPGGNTGIIGWFNFLHKGIGFFAYAMHRISGIVIVLYLYLHFFVLSNLLRGGVTFNSLITSFTYGPYDIFIVMDILLSLVIFYHGANGIRLMLNEAGLGLKHHKLLFFVFESVAMILMLLFLYYAWQVLLSGAGV